MPNSLSPTPLGSKRRTQLGVARALMRLGSLVNLVRRAPVPPAELSIHRYGERAGEDLQYIAPRAGVPQRAPLVYIHGGGWIMGKKEFYTRELLAFAEAGHPIFNLEYPLAPENPHPGILRSLLSALAWIRDRHPELDGVHLMGDSAGGNLVMMLGILSSNPHLIADLGAGAAATEPLHCHSVVSIYGVLDRLTWLADGFPASGLMLECYGGRAAFEADVDKGLALTPMDLEFDRHPPSFLGVGTKDPLRRSSKLCAEKLQRLGGTFVHKEYPGEGHGFFNMGWRPAAVELRNDALEFLAAHDPGVRGD